MQPLGTRFVRSFLVACAALSLAFPPPAAAVVKNFIAVLNGGQEVPPSTTSTGLGVASFTFDTQTGALCYTLSYLSLTAAETASHIHGPASPGTDAGILRDISPAPPGPSDPISPKVGCVAPPLDATLARELKAGRLYVNVHTSTFPLGEIRGQIVPVKGK